MTYDTINDAVTMQGGEGTLLARRYRIIRQLGTGGMGSVWLAEDTLLDNKLFAVKMLPSVLVSNKRAYRQLKDEAIVAMKLVHPNIVQIRAFEENNGNPFLVMDYVDGETLDDYLAEHCGEGLTQSRREAEGGGGEAGGLPEAEVIRLLKPIAAALDYAHGEGVVHRDVKPANVMIRKDGHPYILDFGIAREIQETMTRVTGKLSSGTLLYMSPEQLHGASPKPAQDIYSFAAMAYECLKGEPPFVRGQIEYQIDNDTPAPLGPHIIISGQVMKGLAKKPEDRPDTCAAVLEGMIRNIETGGTSHRSQMSRFQSIKIVSDLSSAPSKPVEIPEADRNYLPSDAKYQSDVVFKTVEKVEFNTRNGDETKSGKDSLSHSKKDYSFEPATKRSATRVEGGTLFFCVLGVLFFILVSIGMWREFGSKEARRMERAQRIAEEKRKAEEAAKAQAEERRAREIERRAREDAERQAEQERTQTINKWREEVERRTQEAEKPRVYLTATLDGVSVNAVITEGMQENNKYRTPLNVDVKLPIGASGEFAAEYSANGVKYVGKARYISRKGLQNVEIKLCRASEGWRPRPATMNFCRHCRYSLKNYSTIGPTCPNCGKNLFGMGGNPPGRFNNSSNVSSKKPASSNSDGTWGQIISGVLQGVGAGL